MRALPGNRQSFLAPRFKPEDEIIWKQRKAAWDFLKKTGALGHDLEPEPDGNGGYKANCKMCGKLFQHESKEVFSALAVMDKCPGLPNFRTQ